MFAFLRIGPCSHGPHSPCHPANRLVAASAIALFISQVALAQEASEANPNAAVPDASEVTVLPPVEVIVPKQPIARKNRKGSQSPTSAPIAMEPAVADATGPVGESSQVGKFTLGQLDLIGGSVVSNQAMWTFNKTSLDQAVTIVPGVSAQASGGPRNERNIFVRGFDRFAVPLSIDGVRVYLPADNRLDFGRFLTPDVAEIQIQKGYVSVLNGPGGMGGAINLVTRKPLKAFEAEARTGVVFDGDLSSRNSAMAYGMTGTRKEEYYAQISGTIVDQDKWTLSNDFSPTAFEDGGARDQSATRDWRINVKAGFTPNATDEYAITYTKQSGEKSAPLHVRGVQPVWAGGPPPRYWEWPYWDIENLAFMSKTQLGAASYVKTTAYYNTFNNLLSSFDNDLHQTKFAGYAFDSWYDDNAYGGSVEFGTELIPMNTLKAALHYRFDHHREQQFRQPDNLFAAYLEPWQHTEEKTWSFALENTFHATRHLDIVAGVSWDGNDLLKAEEVSTDKVFFNQPTGSTDAVNWQTAAIYSYSDRGKVHTSVSSRTRFPTIFERFSDRFGAALPNPALSPERATNYEIGIADVLWKQARVSSAVFYSDIEQMILSVPVGNLSQTQNVGSGKSYGFEASVDVDVTSTLRVGGNYTYLEREVNDPTRPELRPEGTPQHQAFLYLAWSPTDALTITPNVELASDRWSIVSQSGPTYNGYIKTGRYALLNFNAEYELSEYYTASIGARNLLDQNYELLEGYPEPGRTFFTNVRVIY